MNKIIVVHYHEIALKGQNRPFFEKALVSNIEKMLGALALEVKRISGRILIEIPPPRWNSTSEVEKIKTKLKKVFGIHHFSFAFVVEANIEKIRQCVRENFDHFKKADSFRVNASRSEKHYPFTSHDLEVQVGAVIHKEMGVKVDLENPRKTLFVEVAENKAYLYEEKILGPGGLPFGVSGKVVVLISPGFDSPVAAWYMMKRGCEPLFVHFHSYPQTTSDSVENVGKIIEVLSGWSPKHFKLFLVPFLKIQEKIAAEGVDDLRIIMYRRWMLKIAQMIANEVRAEVLVTGDSVAQVSSQTLENIKTISEAVSIPILRPLAGFDKQEIIDKSKYIGTHYLSSLPYDDCCTLFASIHPKTKSKIEDIRKVETLIKTELEKLAKTSLKVSKEKGYWQGS